MLSIWRLVAWRQTEWLTIVTEEWLMWFCQDCMGPASKLIKNMSAIQKRQDEIWSELSRLSNGLGSIESQIKNKRVNDSQLRDNIREIEEMQKGMEKMHLRNTSKNAWKLSRMTWQKGYNIFWGSLYGKKGCPFGVKSKNKNKKKNCIIVRWFLSTTHLLTLLYTVHFIHIQL